MTRLLPIRLFAFCLLLSFCIILQGCASTEKTNSGAKVGMHIDAVLEFIVAYPLSWNKDRRLAYGSKTGEVRWTNPDYANTLLTISSNFQKQHDLSKEQQIDQALHDYVGLEVSTKEKMVLPAGEAWHITGNTAGTDIDLYLLLHTNRNYSIVLTTPAGEIGIYQNLMDKVTQSFKALPE